MSRQRLVYDAITARLGVAVCCWAEAAECTCDIGKLRDALTGVVKVHEPGIVNHVTPCEQHRYRPGGTVASYRGIRDCDACVRTPHDECRRCCSGENAACETLENIAAALGIRLEVTQ